MGRQQEQGDGFGILEEFAHGYLERPSTAANARQTSTRPLIFRTLQG